MQETRWCRLAVAWCVAFAGLFVGPELARGQTPSGQDQAAMDAMMKEWTMLASPGEHHKPLAFFVGTWNTKMKMWMGGPGSEATDSDGTSEIAWMMGGRFLREDHKGTLMGQPYEGLGITGYDNFRNVYVNFWAGNSATNVLSMTGSLDPSGKVFRYYGEMDEPTLKVVGRTVKYVVRITGEDQFVFEVIDLHASDDYKVIEITYNRRK